MIGYYQIIDKIHEQLQAQGFKTVTVGDFTEVDLARQNIYPLAHIITVGTEWNVTYPFSFNILVMDMVDFSKDDLRDEVNPVYGQDNTQDVHPDLHVRMSNIIETLKRGDAFEEMYQVTTASADPFKERFENLLAGWNVNLIINVPPYGTIC